MGQCSLDSAYLCQSARNCLRRQLGEALMQWKEFVDLFRFNISEIDVHDAYLIVRLAHEQPGSIPAIVGTVFSHAEISNGDLLQRCEFLALLQSIVVFAKTTSERVSIIGTDVC